MATVRPETTASLLRAAARAGDLWLPVSGMSMGGSIRSGSRVRVVPAHRPRRGEIWAFCGESGAVVVHRFRRCRNDRYLFRGDALPVDDHPVAAERLVGRVVEVERAGQRSRLTALHAVAHVAGLGLRRIVK